MRLLLAFILCSSTVTLAQSAILPLGFIEDTLVSSALKMPTGLTFLPDGRLLILEQGTSRVMIWARGSMAPALQVPAVFVGNESGLLGVAVDPGWPARPFVYLYFTHQDADGFRTNRIVRYTGSGALSNPDSVALTLSAPYVVLDGVPTPNDTHNGGALRFGPDGMLFAGIGDCGTPCAAQDPDDVRGKVLRLDVSAPANPLWRTNSQGIAQVTIAGIPPIGGFSIQVQAYAIDSTLRLPGLLMLSNRETLTLP